MTALEATLGVLRPLVPLLAVVAVVFAGLFLIKFILERRLGKVAGASFRIQLVMLALSLAGLLTIIMVLPVSETLRGQLLSLVGLLLSASIALSATTFLGNAMAGVLLRVVGGFRVGDFVSVGEHFGRVSERGLFHTEIQTENRDLTTLPNLLLVSSAVKVIRSSGTIISAEVSLGYDIGRERVERLLIEASRKASLQEPFVQIVDLGDYSVTYRTAGLLTEVKQILSARSLLRGTVMDELHAAGIEIVSPSFMNTRVLEGGARFMPSGDGSESGSDPDSLVVPEAVVFDKADQAEELEALETSRQAIEEEIESVGQGLGEAASAAEREQLEQRLSAAKQEHDEVARRLARAQEQETTES